MSEWRVASGGSRENAVRKEYAPAARPKGTGYASRRPLKGAQRQNNLMQQTVLNPIYGVAACVAGAFRPGGWWRQGKGLAVLFLIVNFQLSVVNCALAQDAEIMGKVVENNKNRFPIVGAVVFPKGNISKGTTTDFNGNYKVKVPAGGDQVLVFRYTGFKTQEVAINGRAVINVAMDEDNLVKEEVVVTGFKSEKQVESVANISRVKGEVFQQNPTPSFDAALQGRAPGVQITQSTGMAGGAVNIRVRGTGSVSAASEPLIVIDGVPVISGAGGDGGGSVGGSSAGFQLNALADFDPNNIESLEVLKDAAATAQYGSRGANGVILITTRKGKAGKTRFNFNYYTGVEQLPQEWRVKLLDGPGYVRVTDSAYKNSYFSNPNNKAPRTIPDTSNYITFPRASSYTKDLARTTNVDYLDYLLRQGTVNEASLNASGGDARTTFYLGGTFRRNEGVIRGNTYDRLSGKFNLSSVVSNKVKVSLATSVVYTLNQIVPTGTVDAGGSNGGTGGFAAAQYKSLPIFPVYWRDVPGGVNFYSFNPYYNAYDEFAGTNVYLTQDRDYQQNKRGVFRNISNLALDYKILGNLSYRAELGLDYYSASDYTYLSRFLRLSEQNNRRPTAYASDSRTLFQNYNLNQILAYDKNLNEDNKIEATLAQTYQRTVSFSNGIASEVFPNDETRSVSAGQRVINPSGNESEFAFLSGMGILKYGYKGRYFAQASARYEGSSRFAKENRYGLFPSAAVNWIISDEAFLRENRFISLLKARASVGITGNSAGIGNFQSFGLYTPSGGTYVLNPGIVPAQIANQGLTWEKSRAIDVSTDIGLFKNRVELSLTYYRRTTYDLLLALAVPPSQGIPGSFVDNAGSMRNQGVEFTLNTRNLTGKFQWTTEFNISANKNKLLSLGGLRYDAVSGSPYIANYVGQQLSSFFLAEYAGTNEKGEELIYRAERDANNELTGRRTNEKFRPLTLGQIDSNRVAITDKQIQPKFFGGITNTFRYAGFDLSALFSYQFGNYVLDDGERLQSYVNSGSTSNNLRASVLDPGQPKLYYSNAPGVYDVSDVIPQFPYTINDPLRRRATTRFLHDASYVRLRQVTFGYTFPQSLLSRARISSLRLYFTGTNLLRFTKFNGWDPEVSGNLGSSQDRNLQQGITRFDFPQVRTLTAGVQIGF